jgi:hypothetical protein
MCSLVSVRLSRIQVGVADAESLERCGKGRVHLGEVADDVFDARGREGKFLPFMSAYSRPALQNIDNFA